MKNLSLLFLAITSLSLEAAQSKMAQQPSKSPKAAANSWKTNATVTTQPIAVETDLFPPKDATVVTRSQMPSDHPKHSFENLPAHHKARFEDKSQFNHFLKKHAKKYQDVSTELLQDESNKVLYLKATNKVATLKNNTSNKMLYLKTADELATLKVGFKPVLENLNACAKAAHLVMQAKTSEEKGRILGSTLVPTTKKGANSAKIITNMATKYVDPYAIETESSRTVSNCGQSIIEGSRISDIDHTATNFAPTNEAKCAILQTKRITEFTTLLAQLEGFATARDKEAGAQARLAVLDAKAKDLETKLNSKSNEKERVETERALQKITREKAGIIGQLEGAKKDRARKNNAIFVARTESGSVKAWLGFAGAKTADYISNPQETPLMLDELFSKVLPELSEKERKKQAATFLEILTGVKTAATAQLTWTGQQSVKMTSYPEFSCVIDGKDLSSKHVQTERETLSHEKTDLKPLEITAPLSLIKLYRKRAGLDESSALINAKYNPTEIPTLEELHKKTAPQNHWIIDVKTGNWKKEMCTEPVKGAAAV